MNLSGIRDVNELKRLLAAGQISQDDLNNTQISGSFGSFDGGGANGDFGSPAQTNALQAIVAPAMGYGPQMAQGQQSPQIQQAQSPQIQQQGSQDYGDQPSRTMENQNALQSQLESLRALEQAYPGLANQPATDNPRESVRWVEQSYPGLANQQASDAPPHESLRALEQQIPGLAQQSSVPPEQSSTADLRRQGAQFVRNESTGQTIYLGPNGQASDRPTYGSQIQTQEQSQAPRMMQVTGYVGQNRVNMGPQQAPSQVNVDYGQPPMELLGGARAYYSKDEPGVAYVMKDGRPVQKVMLQDQSAQLAYNKEAEAAQLQQAQLAQSQASTAHTVEETRASRVNNPDWLGLDSGGGAPNGAGGAPGSGAGGIDLSKVPPGILQQATAMANGDMALPMTRNGKLNPIAALAFQINPNLKQTDYVQKQATVKDFAPNGIDGQKVKQVNQALHHAGLLLDTIGDLNNFDVAPGIINPIKNMLGPMLSGADVAPGVYKQTADALSLEVRKVYAGAGGGTEGELRDWQASFNPNASPTQQRAYLKRGMDLLRGGIQALQSSYSRGMGPSANFGNLLDDNARAGLAKITQAGLDPGIGDIVGQQSPQGSAPQASSPQASSPQPTQDVGSDPRVVVAPDGSRHRFPTTQAALSFRKAIGQ